MTDHVLRVNLFIYEQLTPTEYLEKAIYRREEARSSSHAPAIKLHKEALQDLWKALSLGNHWAALLLSEYYFYNYHQAPTKIAEQNKLLSVIMINIYNKFKTVENYGNTPHLIKRQQDLQNHWSVELQTAVEVYSIKGIEYMEKARSVYPPNQKVNTQLAEKSHITLWSCVDVNPLLIQYIGDFLSKNSMTDFNTLTNVAINMEKRLPKNQDFHLRPGYYSAKDDSSGNAVPTLGDKIKDIEDV